MYLWLPLSRWYKRLNRRRPDTINDTLDAALDAASQGFIDAVKEVFPDADIDKQNASGDTATCAPIVDGFINDGVDLIMANATPAVMAASNATGDIPIKAMLLYNFAHSIGLYTNNQFFLLLN